MAAIKFSRAAVACGLFALIAIGSAGGAEARNRHVGAQAPASVVGVTAFDARELYDHAVSRVTSEGLPLDPRHVAEAMQHAYRARGLFLASVTHRIAPRRGDVTYIVNEGRITRIEVAGVDPWIGDALRAVAANAIRGGPARLADVERGVMMAGDLGGIQLRSEFAEEADGSGFALRLTASAVRQRGVLSVDNPPRKFGKVLSGGLSQQFFSTFVPGDMLRFSLSGARVLRENDGSIYGGVYYRTPIGLDGAYAEVFAGTTRTRRDASGNLQDTQQVGSQFVGLIGYPILRDAHQFLYVLAEVDRLRARSERSGPSFTSESLAGRASLVYSNAQASGGSTKFIATLSAGHDGDDPLPGAPARRSGFLHLRAHVGHVQPLDALWAGLAVRLEATGQWAPVRVPAVETFHLGDRYRMRGYRFAEFEGRSGVSGTVELSQDIDVGGGFFRTLRPYVFLDGGAIRTTTAAGARDEKVLYSLGTGVRADLAAQMSVNAWVGAPVSRGASGKRAGPVAYLSLSTYW
ncbi:MAG: ShlB/FhaC/HecB family hemolysin secretion/activation protein [Beijerinckiaceae bacterium]